MLWSFVFLMILFALDEEHVRINLLLELVYTICLFIEQACLEKGVCYITEAACDRLILKNIPHGALLGDNCESLYGALRVFGIDTLMPIIASLTAISMFAILVTNNPWKKVQGKVLESKDSGISKLAAENIRLIILAEYFVLQMIVSFII